MTKARGLRAALFDDPSKIVAFVLEPGTPAM
jgi:hypothetical protein